MSKEQKPETSKAGETGADKDVISRNPNLELAQKRFLLTHSNVPKERKEQLWAEVLEEVKEYEMAPFYTVICAELKTAPDAALVSSIQTKNEAKLKEIAAEIVDSEQNLGESEVRQAWLKKSEYLCQIGDKDAAVTAIKTTYEKTVGVGYRIDLVFNLIRIGLFWLDHRLINENITKAKELMEQGGDWERKNRLRSYEALHKMSIRDFVGAASLFLEAVPTFGSYELMTYEQLVFYSVVSCIYALERPEVRKKVVQCNEIQEQLTGGGTGGALVLIRDYLTAFYECHYDKFFNTLARLEEERLIMDRYLAPHALFYSRAMRLRAYQQFLTPYKTVRMDMMARDFGVSRAFIDAELHGFVASNQLHCKIDAIKGVIEMNHPDSKNHLYKSLIKDGDILLNRIQKLARVINA